MPGEGLASVTRDDEPAHSRPDVAGPGAAAERARPGGGRVDEAFRPGAGSRLRPAAPLRLQGTAGNRAVQRLVERPQEPEQPT